MLKVNSKSNKALIIAAAVERGIFASNKDAENKTCKELYSLIKEWDELHSAVDDNSQGIKNVEAGQANNKQPVETHECANVAETENKSEKPKLKIAAFRSFFLRKLRTEYGVDYETLGGSGLKKQDYIMAINNLNSCIYEAMHKLEKENDAIVKMQVMEANKNNGELKLFEAEFYICRDMINRIDNPESSTAVVKFPITGEQIKSHAKVEDEEKEAVIVNEIISRMELMRAELEGAKAAIDKLTKENSALKAALNKASDENNKLLERATAKIKAYEDGIAANACEMANALNLIAHTKDESNLVIWDMLKKNYDKAYKDIDTNIIIVDMRKLINNSDDPESSQIEEQEIETPVVDSENDYNGQHISFISGDAAKPDGVKKREYAKYKEWYDDAFSWLAYVSDVEKISNNKAKKKRYKELKTEIHGWYDEWYESCDEVTVDMVIATVEQLIEDGDFKKAMSDMTAIIDELEL